MATGLSEKQLNLARKFYYGKFYFTNSKLHFFMKLINKFLIYFFNFKTLLINLKRILFRNLNISLKKKHYNKVEININIKDKDLDRYSNELKKNKFVFIENFIDNNTYQQVLENWPNINFYQKSSKIIKNYSIGFLLNRENKSSDNFQKYIELKELYKFISSSQFSKIINKLLNFENLDFYNYSILSSMVGNNSFLIPHIDGVINKKDSIVVYNFIYFVDGNDSNLAFSGATGIYQDNNFEKPLFLPTTLKNSLLIYKSTESFYHGFQFTKLPKKIYRKTINFQFLSKVEN